MDTRETADRASGWTGDATRPVTRGVPSPDDTVAGRPALPILDDAARSPDPAVCPFLRRGADGVLTAPAGDAAEDHTCIAIGAPRPQSLRQQELVCLRIAHSDCPRYLRGALVAAPGVQPRSVPTVPRATLAALLILVLSAGISFGFVVQRGGIAMPVVGAASSPSPAAAVATATAEAHATGAPLPTEPATVPAASSPSTAPASGDASTPPPSPTIAPTPTPGPTPAATPAATPAPTPAPTPKASPKATKAPTSSRYKLLDPCPDREDCWIYTVRSGDNLYSIANYFGHSLGTIYDWNPQYPDKRLRVGDEIRMPPPTR